MHNRFYKRIKYQIEELEDLTFSKTEISDEISHKLRTPLTVIRGFIELLLNSDDLNSSQREDLDLILKNETKLEQVVSEIENILIELSKSKF